MKRRLGAVASPTNDADSVSDNVPASLHASSPPRIVNSTVSFALGPINPYFSCRLCDGYFRDPVTITECLHTFCKSCLYYAFSSGFTICPTCDVELGPDPIKSTLPDRTKEHLIDRVLFPDLKETDTELEQLFYKQKGIAMKAQYREKQAKKLTDSRANTDVSIHHNDDRLRPHIDTNYGDELKFSLLPANTNVPKLPYHSFTTSGRIKVLQLKRFLLARLDSKRDPQDVEMMVNGSMVGNELSLTFIQRTMWLDPDQPVELMYRLTDGI